MAINIYDTRTMMAAVSKMMPVNTFFRDTFFPRVETYVTEQVDVDVKKGKRKMAPFVAPRVGGIIVDRQGFETRTLKLPKIAPQRVMSADDLAKRSMGESVYSLKTPEERAAQLLGADLAELDELITRREEWQCRQILIDGKVTMKGIIDDRSGQSIDQEVNYNLTNKVTFAGADVWTADTSDKYEALKELRLKIIKTSGRAPNIVVFASDVVGLFLADAKIQKILDVQRFNLGTIEPSIVNDAVTYIGKLPGLGLEIYSLDNWFIDDDGVEQPMMPAGHIIMGRTGMGKRLYGAVTQLEGENFVTFEGTRIPRQWVDVNNEVKMLKISSRPLPVPEDVDDWYVAKVY